MQELLQIYGQAETQTANEQGKRTEKTRNQADDSESSDKDQPFDRQYSILLECIESIAGEKEHCNECWLLFLILRLCK